jgi:iron complex outermembrane receptor protein
MTLEELKQTLSQGNHALAIYDQDEQLHTYDNKGVRDLYTLLTTEPQVLKGAMVADKVVGKGAAALMIVGGIAELHTHIISEPAIKLLELSGIRYSFDEKVDHIENRDKTGWCPVETLCKDMPTAGQCVPLIANFIENMKIKNS